MKYALVKLLFVSILLTVAVNAQVNHSGITGRTVSLALPKVLAENDGVWLELKIGNLTKGSEIEIWSVEGRFLGVISPFGPASRDTRVVATYVFPIPRDAVDNDRLEIRLVVDGPNHVERAPTKRNVRSVKLKVTSTK